MKDRVRPDLPNVRVDLTAVRKTGQAVKNPQADTKSAKKPTFCAGHGHGHGRPGQQRER